MLIVSSCGGSSITQEDYDAVTAEKSELEGQLKTVQDKLNTTEKELAGSRSELESLKKEYDEYKESMKPFEEMTEAQAKAEKAKAEKEAAKIEEEKAAKEAAEKEEQERKEAEEKAAREAEEAKGYETGITYDQLARTPDDYISKKIKFYGKVIQVMEGDDSVQIRLAVDGDYDTVLLGSYKKSIVKSRVLEDDYITIYGTSIGLISYDSTMGGKITIPAALIEKIDQ
ncbi:MAG: toxin regulator [Sarcina sp.]|nr:toxin regulator [Sarcina sp.]